MSFQPVVLSAGIAGWRFLQRTRDTQLEAFAKAPELQRDRDYFLSHIGEIGSAAELVADRRLLSVALGAFGLDDDLNNRAFVRKVLEDGTTSDDALSNRLADETYQRFSAAFGFGPGETVRTGDATHMKQLVDLRETVAFEVAVGEEDEDMRIALYAERELQGLAAETGSEKAKWYSLMALAPLRSMVETAFGLPSSFSQLDIDQQLEVFRDRTRALTGDDSVSQFSDPEAVEKLTSLFLARSQIDSGAVASPASIALTLLRSG